MNGWTQLGRRLREAAWLRQPETQTIFALLDGSEKRGRVVGGRVRDTLLGLGRASPDVDFATELLPAEVMARAARQGIAAYPTGIAHGTVTVRVGDVVAEVTTLRQDVETDGRHAVVRFGTDWAADAARRDFTINALYAEADGTLFDPLGGAADLSPPRVRFIGDPDRRIAEDRLRVYRFFRFSASHAGERFDAAGLAAVRRAAGALGQLSAERVGTEMRRMLALPHVATTLKAMADAGMLALRAQTLEWLRRYGAQAEAPLLSARLALILAGEDMDLQQLWRLSNEEIGTAREVLAAARLLADFHIYEAAYRHPSRLAEATDVAAVLAGWTSAGKSAVADRLCKIEPGPFPLGGADLIALGMKPGPRLGGELARLERAWIDSRFALDREALLELVGR